MDTAALLIIVINNGRGDAARTEGCLIVTAYSRIEDYNAKIYADKVETDEYFIMWLKTRIINANQAAWRTAEYFDHREKHWRKVVDKAVEMIDAM